MANFVGLKAESDANKQQYLYFLDFFGYARLLFKQMGMTRGAFCKQTAFSSFKVQLRRDLYKYMRNIGKHVYNTSRNFSLPFKLPFYSSL